MLKWELERNLEFNLASLKGTLEEETEEWVLVTQGELVGHHFIYCWIPDSLYLLPC